VLLVAERATLADELGRWMRTRRLQPTQLARLAGVSRPTIHNALRGDRISGDSIRAIARGLAMDPESEQLDPTVYADVLRDLADAAGRPAIAEDIPAADLDSEIRSIVKSPKRAAAFAAFLRKYPSMSADQRRLVDALIDHLGDD
jgi:transcriptional regulator with XRE-family HTH domain